MDWNDLRYVLEASRQNGISGAARTLGVNHATVARRITAIEESLQVKLFDRLPTGYTPTEAGAIAVESATKMETLALDLDRTLGGQDQSIAGPLIVTAPELVVAYILGPILRDFAALFPDVEVKVRGTNETLNLARREADVAIRVSNQPHETLVGRKVTDQKSAVYASEDYLARLKDDPDQRLAWLEFEHWTGILPLVKKVYPNAYVAMTFDDMTAIMGALNAGIGATRIGCFIGDQTPGLVRLPGIPLMPYLGIWVLTHPDLRKVARIAAFTRFAGDRLAQMRPHFEGAPA